MKKSLLKNSLLVVFVLGVVCALTILAFAQREQQLQTQYTQLMARKIELETALKATKNNIQQVLGMLQERRVANGEIQRLESKVKELEPDEE